MWKLDSKFGIVSFYERSCGNRKESSRMLRHYADL